MKSNFARIAGAFSLSIVGLLAIPPGNPSTGQETITPVAKSELITLDRIMADPEWIGRSPENAFWADDSASIYYEQKQVGSEEKSVFQTDLDGNVLRVVDDKDRGRIDSATGQFSKDRKWKAYQRAGDVFVKNLQTGAIRQVTRTTERESSPRFMADGQRLMFVRDRSVFARHLKSGLEQELVDLRLENDPEDGRQASREGFLPEQQQRLFDYLRDSREKQDEAREREQQQHAADPTRTPLPWYLGDSYDLKTVEVSPNGRWCLVSLSSKKATEGTPDKMPEFVFDTGYVNSRNVRPLVGTGKAVSDKLLLLDLRTHKQHELEFTGLPKFDSDPLADVRIAADAWRKQWAETHSDADSELSLAEPDVGSASRSETESNTPDSDVEDKAKAVVRAVQVGSIEWNDAGNQVAVQLFSADNKDRWITTVDFKAKKLQSVMHRRDLAWINWNVGQVAWLPDHQSLHYITEETGYAHLYVTHAPTKNTRQLTKGDFVVTDVQAGLDGRYLYYKANAKHPGIYEAYRVEVATGVIEQLTDLGGMNDFVVSPDEKHLLVTHSTALSPPELWMQPIADERTAKQLTITVTPQFSELPWVAPQFVTVPSRAGRPIHARLYLPPNHDPAKPSPAVIFIHGAGYLQNAHQGWSGYFREFMFHSLLAHRGFVVLDMDYRASAGYGRDWRTAIYRHMGGPELEDIEDGQAWLAETQAVDVKRVGLYGGSYGGFMTMMALFQRPGKFACGAALRPVTDWAHYNHGYTSNILNTPDIDPEAFYRSSPIELASGLADPLLICHGMVDDNVFFKDTARLAQRLIELRKKDWEVAIYPVEPHGFREPSSWYDEYRRILELFERVLTP
jgi:dipeptidyl aminopeptidase/acylaminoacyl peptidase